MPEQTFRSPGYGDTESELTPSGNSPSGTPAGVVGTSNKGPAFVPTTVADFPASFKNEFGDVDPKKAAPYAAAGFLQNRNALTFLRVLGAGSSKTAADVDLTSTTDQVVNAGFSVIGTQTASTPHDGRYQGCVQFIVAKHNLQAAEAFGFPMFSENDAFAGSSVNVVRAMVLLASGTRMHVIGSSETAASAFAAGSPDDYAASADGTFKLVLSSSDGFSFGHSDGVSGVKIYSASLDPDSANYVGKLLNTDPDKFATAQHLLYGDFAIDNQIATPVAVGVVSGSAAVSQGSGDPTMTFRDAFGRFNTRYKTPRTTNFISQPFGQTEYDLFHFESLDDGAFANSLYKVSISNIKPSADQSNPYGTFMVVVRDWNDNDLNPIVLERYPNLTLDPNAKNYIARVIGDKKTFYNFDTADVNERRLVTQGKYDNVSSRIRVVMSDSVSRGMIPKTSLPFGFRGLPALKTNDDLKDAGSLHPRRLGMVITDTNVTSSMSGSIVPPVPLRVKVTKGTTATSGFVGNPGPTEIATPAFYWGVKFERNDVPLNPNVASDKNPLLLAYTQMMGLRGLDVLVTGSAADTFNDNKFTLARVAFSQTDVSQLTASVNQHMREAAYIRNGKPDPTTYAITDSILGKRITFGTLLAQQTPADYNRFLSYAKFTNFFYGGFDGVNILDKDARQLNDRSTSLEAGGGAESSYVSPGLSANVAGSGVDNNAVNSYVEAIRIMTDPMGVAINLLAIPGIREPYITDTAAESTRDFGLAMLVMDIASYDTNGSRIFDDSTVKPTVDQTATNFDARSIDNNYVAVYWPDVQIADPNTDRRVKVPASVAAMMALGFNDKVAYPWFSPAGFNRASLDGVKNTAVRVSAPDRDRLQDVKINPIASFPRSGFVIYGQKTLQQSPSALDRVNVRRLLIEVKRQIIELAYAIEFENFDPEVFKKFVKQANTRLGLIKLKAGVQSFAVVMDNTNNTPADEANYTVNGKIVVQPTKDIENIEMNFVITNNGLAFV